MMNAGYGLLLTGMLTFPVAAHAQACPAAPTGTDALETLRYLASDSLQGRLAGSPGERCAGEFIAARFAALGLEPGANGYFQEFDLASAVNPHAPAGRGRNVIGILAGTDPLLRDEAIVVGAHYDHLGHGGSGSLAPGDSSIHNGADDNASGVTALLEIAERLVATKPARSIVFTAFSGEESGLLGSAFYASNPEIPMARTRAMLNLDMVGKLATGGLIVSGIGTANEWKSLLASANGDSIAMKLDPSGYGPSDHTSFYTKEVPVLHFFTNTHPDYHRPTDDWQGVDIEGVETIAALVAPAGPRSRT